MFSRHTLDVYYHNLEQFVFYNYQDSDLTWNTQDPDFTPCFLQTALVWAPFGFLLLFSPLDIYFARTSKYSNIPWGFHNISRVLLVVLLVAHAVADVAVGATWHSEIHLAPVHWVTPAIRLVMFVRKLQIVSEMTIY